MPEESTRKLAVIMIGDIYGYARLMGDDERGTVERVQRLYDELLTPTINDHRGQLIGTRGDGFLVIFNSPVEAVRCAIIIQQSMVGQNLELPESRWIRFRIGVNLGDIIFKGGDVQGEGVNIAARLENMADPGFIFISGGVYEQIRYKLVCGYQSLGDRRVKNITDPVPVYRVLPDPAALVKATKSGKRRKRVLLAVSGLVLIIVFGAGVYAFRFIEPPISVASRTPSPPPLPTPPPVQPAIATVEAPPQRMVPKETPPPVVALPPPVPVPEPPTQTAAIVRPPQPAPAPEPPIEPEMVSLAGGNFQMGSNDDPTEKPIHRVTIAPFLIGKYPVTVQQWRSCVQAKACSYTPSGPDTAPVSNISWRDAQQYVTWLSQVSQRRYRLPSEAEWEFAARAGTDTRYWWGNAIKPGFAICKGCGEATQPVKVGSRPANPFGVFDIGGGVTEWMQDCWVKDYAGAPIDGSARQVTDCHDRVLRNGSWANDPSYVRTTSRDAYDAGVRYPTHGFRVARSP